MEECTKFIKLRREARHKNTLERQTANYNWLCHKNKGGHSNIQDGNHGKQGKFGSQQQQDDSSNTPDHVSCGWAISLTSHSQQCKKGY